jgi:PAS domain S-box-containing protein
MRFIFCKSIRKAYKVILIWNIKNYGQCFNTLQLFPCPGENMKNKEDSTGDHDSAQIRSEAEQKVRAIKSPDLEFMTCEEIGQMFHEMQARQLEMEMQVRHLQSMLKESEDQKEVLTTITENMLDLVSLADIEGNLIFLGKSHDIFGYELKSLQAKNVMDFVHPEDLSRVLEAYKELVTSGTPSRIEYRCRCKDGSYLWIETRGTFFRDENNNPQGIIFSSRDITERRIAEQKLRESKEEAVQKERLYRLLFEQSPLGVFHVDENGVIVSCNDKFIKIIGSSRKALVGLDMKKLPDQKLVKELRKALAGSHAFYKDTYHSVTAEKSTPVKVYFSPLITEDATLIGCTGIVEDITERKQAEEAVRQSEALHSKMVANIGEVIVIIDENGINRYKSGNVEKHFGWKPEELVGALTWENVHPDDLPPVRRLFSDII